MRIIGIDPGTATTGFGIIDIKGTAMELVAAGVITTPSNRPLEKRLLTIYSEIDQLIKQYRPKQVVVELLYFAKNVTTAMSVSHARGITLLAAAQAKLPVYEYTPLQVKQAITGHGQAGKYEVQTMVKKLLQLKELPKPDDAADALATAICHSAALGRIIKTW